MVRYGWADSSEQGRNDWLSNKFRYVWTADVVEVASAANALSASSGQLAKQDQLLRRVAHISDSSGGSGDPEHLAEPTLVDRVQLNRVLSNKTHEH
eukprot:15086055-Alexandrium_andersonii.AAC.1